ncbi:hypothetical protein NC651_021484 [Populus alba x Populus x berolinensis]|nr:hypothetical protein NC651_021484 [Populus alba x Populus x berolinensis]
MKREKGRFEREGEREIIVRFVAEGGLSVHHHCAVLFTCRSDPISASISAPWFYGRRPFVLYSSYSLIDVLLNLLAKQAWLKSIQWLGSFVWVEDPEGSFGWIGEVVEVTSILEFPPCGVDDMTKLAIFCDEPAVNKGANQWCLSHILLAVADSAYRVPVNYWLVGKVELVKTESDTMLMRYLAYMGGSEGCHAGGRSVSKSCSGKAFAVMVSLGRFSLIKGGGFQELLLELIYWKSLSGIVKVVSDAESKHVIVFYMLVCAAPAEYKLGNPRTFHYLNQSNFYDLDGVNESEEYLATRRAMDIVGINANEQDAIFRVVAAILHLGNILLNLRMISLITRDESITKWLDPDAATVNRDTLAKIVYSRLFDWIVNTINNSIGQDPNSKSLIGVLDIYGFESFKTNRCLTAIFGINLTNERAGSNTFNQADAGRIYKGRKLIVCFLDQHMKHLAESFIRLSKGPPNVLHKPKVSSQCLHHLSIKLEIASSSCISESKCSFVSGPVPSHCLRNQPKSSKFLINRVLGGVVWKQLGSSCAGYPTRNAFDEFVRTFCHSGTQMCCMADWQQQKFSLRAGGQMAELDAHSQDELLGRSASIIPEETEVALNRFDEMPEKRNCLFENPRNYYRRYLANVNSRKTFGPTSLFEVKNEQPKIFLPLNVPGEVGVCSLLRRLVLFQAEQKSKNAGKVKVEEYSPGAEPRGIQKHRKMQHYAQHCKKCSLNSKTSKALNDESIKKEAEQVPTILEKSPVIDNMNCANGKLTGKEN